MPAYDRKLYNNLPLYARLADEEGILKHICDVIQIEIDKSYRALYNRQFAFDPTSAPDEWLQFLGQLVALAPQGSKYLGIGMNPDWSVEQKRRLLLNAWKYWQKKGTPQGIREAIWLWLDWEGALDHEKLYILQPFGDRPSAKPANWINWGSLYNSNSIRKYREKSFLGAEQIVKYRPNYLVRNIDQEEWNRPEEEVNLSHLSPNNLWIHAILTDDEWIKIFPDITELLREAVPAGRKPVVFGWLRNDEPVEPVEIELEDAYKTVQELRTDGFKWGILSSVDFEWGGNVLPVVNSGEINSDHLWSTRKVVFFREFIAPRWTNETIFNYSPILIDASDAKNWFLYLESESREYKFSPVSIFWHKDNENHRSFSFSLTQFNNLFLEFVFHPQQEDKIKKLSLKLKDRIIQQIEPENELPINSIFNAGFQFSVLFEVNQDTEE